MDTRVKPAHDAECAAVILPFRERQFMQPATREATLDLAGMVARNGLLRLKTTVIGMKMFARVEDMAAIRRSAAGQYRPPFPGVERSVDCALGQCYILRLDISCRSASS
jgi:hypothetical protein